VQNFQGRKFYTIERACELLQISRKICGNFAEKVSTDLLELEEILKSLNLTGEYKIYSDHRALLT